MDYASFGCGVLSRQSLAGGIDTRELATAAAAYERRARLIRDVAYAAQNRGAPGFLRPSESRVSDSFNQYTKPSPNTGWTAPTTTYERMRDIDRGAAVLEGRAALVASQEYRDAWKVWFKNWRTFFEKRMETYSKLGALFHSDEMAAQTESYRQQLMQWEATYKNQKSVTGGSLPPLEVPITPMQPGVPDVTPPKKDEGYNWWVIGGVSLAVVVVGTGLYFATRRMIREADEKKALIEKHVLPAMMASHGLGRDPAGVESASDVSPPDGVSL